MAVVGTLAAAPTPQTPSATATTSGARSPGLILLVATLAILLISIQSLSELSELLFSHVDDSFLEDGVFSSISLNDDGTMEMYTEAKRSPVNRTIKAYQPPDDVPITLQIRLVKLTDEYSLSDSNVSSLDDVLVKAKAIWLRANIHLNFTNVYVERLDDVKADAYRWFVLGSKDQKKSKFWVDVSTYLKRSMSASQAGEVISKYFQYSGYPLMDWIMTTTTTNSHDFDLVFINLWPWNNGGNLGSKLAIRTGSCLTTSRLRRSMIMCNGWSKSAREAPKLSSSELARAMAHLIGRRLGLPQPSKTKCSVWTEQGGLLMCAGEVGSPIWATALRLEPEEITLARDSAATLVQKRSHEDTVL